MKGESDFEEMYIREGREEIKERGGEKSEVKRGKIKRVTKYIN